MVEKKYTWFRIGEPGEVIVQEREIGELTVNGKKVCITRYKNRLYAFAYKCPHAGGILADGYIDGEGHVVCPLHRYEFDIRNGHNSSGEGFYLRTYPVEAREGGIYIGFAESSLWNIFGG